MGEAVRRCHVRSCTPRVDDRLAVGREKMILVRSPDERFGDQTLGLGSDPPCAVQAPRCDHARKRIKGCQCLRERLSNGGEQELIDIEKGDPPSMAPMMPQAMAVGG